MLLSEFMFQLADAEKAEVVANCDRLRKLKCSPVLPDAFTEHGAIMAATMLNRPRAVRMSVLVLRAFVKRREALVHHRELVCKRAELQCRLAGHVSSASERNGPVKDGVKREEFQR